LCPGRDGSPRFVGVASAGTIPFVDIADKDLISSACFSPA
jgi:hypothetical protein